MTEQIDIELILPPDTAGQRLDRVLAELLPNFSRRRLQQWLQDGELLINGSPAKTRYKVKGGEQVLLNTQLREQTSWQAEDIPLEIVAEDDDLIVINKPPGLVVHPGAGNLENTLVNGLLFHYPELAQLPRCGIIHRIDKDTSGLLLVPRNLTAHTKLSLQLQDHSMAREYYALVENPMISSGQINAPIGRDPQHRTRMAVVSNGKPAITHYRIQQRFRAHTLLDVQLETGRTHQIRVHLANIRHPLVGDRLYGYKAKLPKGADAQLIHALQQFPRQALHAYRLRCQHPKTNKVCEWQIAPAADMQALVALLTNDAESVIIDPAAN